MWRRAGAAREYQGRLAATDGLLYLRGRDLGTGIEVSLAIPFSEIAQARPSAGADEMVQGRAGVVLDLAGSQAICLRALAGGGEEPLLRRLRALLAAQRPPARALVAR